VLKLIVRLLLVWFSSVLAFTMLALSAYNLVVVAQQVKVLTQKRCFTGDIDSHADILTADN